MKVLCYLLCLQDSSLRSNNKAIRPLKSPFKSISLDKPGGWGWWMRLNCWLHKHEHHTYQKNQQMKYRIFDEEEINYTWREFLPDWNFTPSKESIFLLPVVVMFLFFSWISNWAILFLTFSYKKSDMNPDLFLFFSWTMMTVITHRREYNPLIRCFLNTVPRVCVG